MTARGEGARRKARELAFRIVYQGDVVGDSYRDAWSRLEGDESLSRDQREVVEDVIGLLEKRGTEVDATISAAAEHWDLERLAATDRAVLRVAVAELMSRPGTPVRVVLDEAIEIAKRYGAEESGRFVNGVLDRVSRSLRPAEL